MRGIEAVNGIVWGPMGLGLLFGTGLLLTVRTGGFQLRRWGMEKGGGGSAHEMLCVAEIQGSGSSWEPCSLIGGMNRARKVKAMTVRSSICPTPGMKSGIRSMGEKA